MAKLNSGQRSALPSSEFGLSSERKYPMPDPSHASNAKARASQMERRGRITQGQKKQIDSKANKVLGYGR